MSAKNKMRTRQTDTHTGVRKGEKKMGANKETERDNQTQLDRRRNRQIYVKSKRK